MKWVSKEVGTRNQLYGVMKYRIVCDFPGFFSIREWCWNQWGPGIEHEHYINHQFYTGADPVWCWDAAKFQGASRKDGQIYLKDDDLLTQFKLAWA